MPGRCLEIKEKIKSAGIAIEDEKNDIVRAVGSGSLSQMREYLKGYAEAVDIIIQYPSRDSRTETRLRTAGKTLREFSQTMTKLERERMNDIIARSKKILLYSFLGNLRLGHTRQPFYLPEDTRLTQGNREDDHVHIKGRLQKDR